MLDFRTELDNTPSLIHIAIRNFSWGISMEEPKTMPVLSSAMEDYLEAIYHLEQTHRIARVRDIADRLGVKMSSVSSALKSLGSRGLIRYDPHQFITLTERGMEKAEDIVRNHEILQRFFQRVLKLDPASAEDNACRIEHHLDPEVIEKLIRFLEFIELCPVEQTRRFDGINDTCRDCISCLDCAKDKVLNRTRLQEEALAVGMTLAEIKPGSQVIIDSFKEDSRIQRLLSERTLSPGTIVEVEKNHSETGGVSVNIKGYHVSLSSEEASAVFVKPLC
jgi:DtxR family transcriptional regulator, Mn-dependent transcriptional regulator